MHRFSCKTCVTPFTMKQSYLTEYRKRFGKDPMYCSRPCSAVGRKADAEARNSFSCAQCGKVNPRRRRPSGNLYYQQKFCDAACKAESQRQEFRDRFAAGNFTKRIGRGGYVWMRIPTAPGQPRREVLEHRFVVETAIGRKLTKEETVHHVNGDRADNREENLELFASRHGPGQRVSDIVREAIEVLKKYPEYAEKEGYSIVPVDDYSIEDFGICGPQSRDDKPLLNSGMESV